MERAFLLINVATVTMEAKKIRQETGTMNECRLDNSDN